MTNPACPPPSANKAKLVYVRYVDHVLYNRTSALAMYPQVREAVGWVVYDCENYLTLCWDRDAGPTTLHGGDPKAWASLIKSDIIAIKGIESVSTTTRFS